MSEPFASVAWMWEDLEQGLKAKGNINEITLAKSKMMFAMGAYSFIMVQRKTMLNALNESGADVMAGALESKRVHDETMAFCEQALGGAESAVKAGLEQHEIDAIFGRTTQQGD